jgi:eukaryotic-like serine/threonine-protein kinase
VVQAGAVSCLRSTWAPRFELVRPVGAGGMGMVFEARDRSKGGARVALKVLPHAAGGAEVGGELADRQAARLLRFKREFRTLAEVAHPNLVRLFDLVEHEGV